MVNSSGKLAKSNLWTLRNHSNVLDPERRAIPGHDDRAFDVLGTVHQSNRAHVDLLQAFLDKASAGVDVIIRELLLNLGQAQAVRNELVGGPREPGIRE